MHVGYFTKAFSRKLRVTYRDIVMKERREITETEINEKLKSYEILVKSPGAASVATRVVLCEIIWYKENM